jgi:hypothetical protein
MFSNNFPMRNAPRAELDQRARDARLRLERVERLLMPRPAVRFPWFKALICLSYPRAFAGARRKARTGGPLSDWRLSFYPAA